MIRKKLISSSSQKARIVLVPNLDHVLWHTVKKRLGVTSLWDNNSISKEPSRGYWLLEVNDLDTPVLYKFRTCLAR